MLANYIVLIDNHLADVRNFPDLKDIVLNDATFFWKSTAIDYRNKLEQLLFSHSIFFNIELRKI